MHDDDPIGHWGQKSIKILPPYVRINRDFIHLKLVFREDYQPR
ncbi:hypothetical protein CORMATOL_00391 [Corynebacterium matruchotii ATCC 33806]|uniref:Uncharacterized protein n=1 Tax=Corynebacterium matruchotii ATCC 33806 TaxID=566549 RepID=C0E091_9CORY|nr:hypothetical protein CORMATOL_00391 [Corynebacterium matruchotii ATCC 33806]